MQLELRRPCSEGCGLLLGGAQPCGQVAIFLISKARPVWHSAGVSPTPRQREDRPLNRLRESGTRVQPRSGIHRPTPTPTAVAKLLYLTRTRGKRPRVRCGQTAYPIAGNASTVADGKGVHGDICALHPPTECPKL